MVINGKVFYRWYEVKSQYTFNKFGADSEIAKQNLAKWEWASMSEGRPFDTYIFGPKGYIVVIFRFFPDRTMNMYRTYNESENDQSETGAIVVKNFILPHFLVTKGTAEEEDVMSISDVANHVSVEMEQDEEADNLDNTDSSDESENSD